MSSKAKSAKEEAPLSPTKKGKKSTKGNSPKKDPKSPAKVKSVKKSAETPVKTSSKKKAAETPQTKPKEKKTGPYEARWKKAMSIFQKFQPGLGHDGTGLYGTLTAGTMRTMIERCEVVGRTHVDVGAADGKVLLGALSLGAAHVYGVEISGDGLQTKFEGMRDVLAQSHAMGASSARLACSIDICDLRGATVEAWLNEVFNESDDTEITVSAVWHGFNTEAKETLLSACARSQRVTRFSLIGPAKRDYGNPEAVIDWVGQCGGACKLVGDDKGHLSGSGENQRIMTFEKVDGGSSPQRALAFDD